MPTAPAPKTGRPAKRCSKRTKLRCPLFADRVARLGRRLSVGDLTEHGLPVPDEGVFSRMYRLGLAPAVISVVCLARMHRADAQELLLTGDRVPAARMVAAGMVNRVVADEDLDGAVDAWVSSLVAGGPEALTHTKDLLRVVPGMGREDGFAHTAALSARLFASPEAAAGMMAFLSRQPAPWVPQG